MKNMDSPVDETQGVENMLEFKTKDGQVFEVPVDGSLGLLALGDLGVIAWRQKRQAYKETLALRTQQNLQGQ